MSVKLSFILPIYNVAHYLQACLDSIYAQGVDEGDFEVICVNDCSPDNSREIVLDYQRKYSNILLVEHLNNRGLSAARNTGVSRATGKYIWFVDSDDVLPNFVLDSLFKKANQDKLDVLLFNYQDISDSGDLIKKNMVFKNTQVTDGVSFIKNIWGDGFVYHMGYVWRCIYSREYIAENSMSFPEGKYWEDTVYFPKAIMLAQRVASTTIVGYSYRNNKNSISVGRSKSLNAKKIYDYCISASIDLLMFSKEISTNNLEYAYRIEKFAKDKYLNTLLLKLLYTSPKEMYKFASLCKKNTLIDVKSYANGMTKVILFFPYTLITMTVLFLQPLWKIYKLLVN